jgi:peptidoglycan hydrolase-like protein with peptidoglycan-binding domain
LSRRVLAWTITPVAVLLVAAGVTAAVWQPWRSPAGTVADATAAVTATAERTTLTSDLILNGTLSYGDDVSLPGGRGTVTRLPKAGDVIAVGQALYEVDGKPVIALRGDRPFWRDLSDGMTAGSDVLQLEQNLAALGFGADVTVDTEFTWATASAVKDWQESLGLERTGVVALGDVIAVDAPSVRVASVTAKLGDQGGSPLTYTSTVLGVVAKLTDAQAREILASTPVMVTLPDGTDLPATIISIDPGGQPTGTEGKTTSATAAITFEDSAAAQGLGLRAVKVKLASSTVADALVIPVTALVATLDGGYAVDVLKNGKTLRVAVEVGLIADTRVQVTGGELAEGDVVVVAQ